MPLSMEMTICPSLYRTVFAVSTKVLMPLLDNNLFVLFPKFLRSWEVPNLHPGRLPELDQILYVENGFTVTLSDVDVNWPMIIIVENKLESFLFKTRDTEN